MRRSKDAKIRHWTTSRNRSSQDPAQRKCRNLIRVTTVYHFYQTDSLRLRLAGMIRMTNLSPGFPGFAQGSSKRTAGRGLSSRAQRRDLRELLFKLKPGMTWKGLMGTVAFSRAGHENFSTIRLFLKPDLTSKRTGTVQQSTGTIRASLVEHFGVN